MAQADAPALYWSEDVPDADWLGAVADPTVVDDAWRAWRDEVAFAEKLVADSPDLGIDEASPDRAEADFACLTREWDLACCAAAGAPPG